MINDIRGLVQNTLDNALYPEIATYWQRKSGEDADEYIVFIQNGDTVENYTDNTALIKNANITVSYYYRSSLANTPKGRKHIKDREDAIQNALESAGFEIPFGKFDAGDVDNIGYFVTVFECEYWRVI